MSRPPTRLVLRPFTGAAAGAGAVTWTLRHLSKEAGLFRGSRLALRMNQEGGFDCAGCAWPEPRERSRFEFCENGAKALAEEATTKRAGRDFFAAHPISELRTWTDHDLGKSGRLTEPMVKRPGADRYEPIAWDDAFSLAAGVLRSLASPHRAAFYASGRTSNEAAFLYQLFVRLYGTNNLPDCSNMCHESSGVGMKEVLGVGKGTVTLEDFDHADCLLVLGQNPGTNHPRMLTTLQAAARRGAAIVAVNPIREAGLVRFKHPQEVLALAGRGTALATHWLQVKAGGDQALLQALGKAVLELEDERPGEVLDHGFLAEHTSGFEAYRDAVRARSWEELTSAAGAPEAAIREVAGVYARSKATIACWAMGLTQHDNGVANVQEVVNLLLLRGNVGRPGAGACPVRGHSNVQGDRTMGIWERPTAAFLDRLGRALGFEPPREHGLSTVEAIEAMDRGQVEVFVGLGGNLAAAAPDTEVTERALRRGRLTVHVATKPNRTHLAAGETSLLLPCLGRTEVDRAGGTPDGPQQLVTVEDSMGLVHASRGQAEPGSPHLRSEPWIVASLARAVLGDRGGFDWEALGGDYDRIRDLVALAIPGFEDMNRRVREPGGFSLPNAARERRFDTADRKARFSVHPLPERRLEAGELVLTTVRSHDQFNTTIYGLDDRYRGVYGERRVVFLHADDMSERGLAPGDAVDLRSRHEGTTREAKGFFAVPLDLPRGTCAAYFPEANALVPLSRRAAGSLTPVSKYVPVTIERARPDVTEAPPPAAPPASRTP